MAEQTAWARDTAAGLLAPLGQRWAHTFGVAERVRTFAGLLPEEELDVLVAAAYLHDGRLRAAPRPHRFHPLDGARFLRRSDASGWHASSRTTRALERRQMSGASAISSTGSRKSGRSSPIV